MSVNPTEPGNVPTRPLTDTDKQVLKILAEASGPITLADLYMKMGIYDNVDEIPSEAFDQPIVLLDKGREALNKLGE